ncbi:hypothetical protein Hamer_G009693 [Homarus americanus]|uniref:Uncharacterized protein n=1 Tax=Homarus americanus TaxID=6706 RepID=A0A8J5N346_HOMAM|nr:hypothetical protein Hamer_G009693 [Homarus americanus]
MVRLTFAPQAGRVKSPWLWLSLLTCSHTTDNIDVKAAQRRDANGVMDNACMGGSLGNLLALMERHIAAQNLANNNSNNNSANNSTFTTCYPITIRTTPVTAPVITSTSLVRLVTPSGQGTKSLPHAARLARSHTSLLHPENISLGRSSRSQGDLMNVGRTSNSTKSRKWTTLRGRALSASSLSLRPKRRAPLSAATLDLGQLEGHMKCQLHHPQQHTHPAVAASTHRGSWSRKLRLPEVRLGQVYATLRGRRSRAVSCDSSLATNAKLYGFGRDRSPQRLRCSRDVNDIVSTFAIVFVGLFAIGEND